MEMESILREARYIKSLAQYPRCSYCSAGAIYGFPLKQLPVKWAFTAAWPKVCDFHKMEMMEISAWKTNYLVCQDSDHFQVEKETIDSCL